MNGSRARAAVAVVCALAFASAAHASDVAIVASADASPLELAAAHVVFKFAGAQNVAADSADLDVLVLAGRVDATSLAPAIEHARFVLALGAATLSLADSGALDERFVCIASDHRAELATRHSNVRAVDSVSFAVDGRFVTSSGGAHAVDALLFVVERLHGETAAKAAGRAAGVEWSLPRVRAFVNDRYPARCLRPGDRIDEDTAVVDASGTERRILDLARADDRIIVLTIFGGGGSGAEADARGGLWCEDSHGELAMLRHSLHRFADSKVRFIAVATPPSRHAERFGYAVTDFHPAHDAAGSAFAAFVAATESARAHGAIPFDEVWFDPDSHLLGNELSNSAHSVAPWSARFRTTAIADRYGTPTTWVLARDGTVIGPPFSGNAFEQAAELNYSERDVEDAIETALRGS